MALVDRFLDDEGHMGVRETLAAFDALLESVLPTSAEQEGVLKITIGTGTTERLCRAVSTSLSTLSNSLIARQGSASLF